VSFRDILGHRPLTALLARSAAEGSLPPSLIFSGPAGVGKRLTAIATAQALNCRASDPAQRSSPPSAPRHARTAATARPRSGEAPGPAQPGPDAPSTPVARGLDACGVCPVCSRIARGLHPDVLLVSPGDTGSIRIEPIRDAIDQTAFRPFEGLRRVVIIDQADAMVVAAQNALLKTLEEPPPSSMFILVTSRPDVLLPTVRSRCPQLRFRPLAVDDVASVLVAGGMSETAARAVAAASGGSIGRALDASAGDLVEARAAAADILALTSATEDPRQRLEGARDLLTRRTGATDREFLATRLRALASLLRDVELLRTGADRGDLANPDLEPALARLSAHRSVIGTRGFAAVDRALAALQANVGVKIVSDWIVLQL
jgi:DNA polymerase-3 subunit delta'